MQETSSISISKLVYIHLYICNALMNLTKTASAIGLTFVLLLKAVIRAAVACCINAKSIIEKVKNLKNPERTFSDVNEFMKLVTDDGDEPDIFTDEQIKRMVGKNRKDKPLSVRETSNSSMFDDDEVCQKPEEPMSPPRVPQKPREEPNLLGTDKKIVDDLV